MSSVTSFMSPSLSDSQPQALPDRRRESRLVERVEVQPRRAARDEAVAEIGHHVETESADRSRVVAVTFELLPYPARNLRAARIREPRELGEASDRHDARNDGH